MSSGDVLGISTSGLLATQRGLSTAGHNIANATTPGYSRQRIDLQPRPPQIFGNGALGTGVVVSNVDRVYNEFLVDQVRENTSSSKYLDKTYEYTRQVDNMLADPKAGLAPAMSNFFEAVNGVANEPSSTAAREVMMGASRNLADRFGYLYNRFEGLREASNKDLYTMVSEVNQIANAIADVNKAIVRAREVANKPPNDLLDQRDRLVQELSEKVDVRVTTQEDGRMNVFIGNGQTLVIGDIASKIDAAPNEHDASKLEVLFKGQGSDIVITQFLGGGQLGGISKFRNEVLEPAQNELGRIAIGIAKSFNDQHRLGMDMNNSLGEDFFSQLNKLAPQVLNSKQNKGDIELGAEINDEGKLTTSNYSLIFKQGEYELLRLDDNKIMGRFRDFPQKISADGFSIFVKRGSTVQEGDRFIIQPTRRGADLFKVLTTSVDKIAAASPVRAEADIDNIGNASITVTQITDTTTPSFNGKPGELSPPYVVRFVDDDHFVISDNTGKPVKVKMAAVADDPTISIHGDRRLTKMAQDANAKSQGVDSSSDDGKNDDNNKVSKKAPNERRFRDDNEQAAMAEGVVEGPIQYNRRKGVEVLPTPGGIDRGFHIRLDGDPKAGDMFRIEFNNDASSDNRNILTLAELQTKPVLMDGKSDYAQTYGQLVSRVGSKTHELDINRSAQKILLDQAINEKESSSGVNLDEEAADIVRFQNQYHANAQVIATANQMLNTLMDTFRR